MENTSSLIILAVVMAVVELVAGGAIGWWMRGSRVDASSHDEVQRARDALSKLHALASQLATDVGEHSTRVQEITSEFFNQGAKGSLDAIVLSIVTKIIAANERLQKQLIAAEVMLREQAHQIEVFAADAVTDALTGAPNRRLFDIELAQRLAEWHRKGTPFCLMMIDVDYFKKFNDVHGHLAGDEVLRGVVRSLQETLREIDIVTRYGGDEFAVIMPSTTLVESEPGAIRCCICVEGRRFDFEGKAFNVTVSGGVAQAKSGEDEATLIKRADKALYAAKEAGRNRVFVHDGQSVRQLGAAELGSQPTAMEWALLAQSVSPVTSAVSSPADDNFGTDTQTGMPNRTVLCEEIRRRVAESHRNESKLSLMLVKVDDLTAVSGRHGVTGVDLVLKTIARFLMAGMREMDFIARYSDDVFAVVLPGASLNQTVGVAERLRIAVARCPLRSKDSEFRVAVSTGLAEVEPNDDCAALLKRTEAAMRGSVQAGCNCTHFNTGNTIERFQLDEAAV